MAKKRTRLLSAILVLIMVVSLLPTSVVAEAPIDQIMNGYYTANDENMSVNATTTDDAVKTSAGSKVSVSKTIEQTAEDAFDITLTVETKQELSQEVSNSDAAVVIVLDKSNTMGYCSECGGRTHKNDCANRKTGSGGGNVSSDQTRLAAAKISAKSFVDSLLENTPKNSDNSYAAHRYVSLVSFSMSATVDSTWIDITVGNNATRLKSLIDGISTSQGTNLQDGLNKALTLMNAVPTVDSKYTVVLTDGVPTKSKNYGSGTGCSKDICDEAKTAADALREVSNIYSICYGADNDKCYDVFESQSVQVDKCQNCDKSENQHCDSDQKCYDDKNNSSHYTKEYKGEYFKYTGSGKVNKNTQCENCTKLKKNHFDGKCDNTSYTYTYKSTYFTAKTETQNVVRTVTVSDFLTSISTEKYSANNASQLQTSFNNISKLIALLTEAWIVKDPMAAYITFGEIKAVDGRTQGASVASCDAGVLTWNLKADVPTSSGNDSDKTYTYKLKYSVTFDSAKAPVSEDSTPIYYKTNDYTYLTYVFYNEDGQLINEDGSLIEDQANATANTISFNVPGVKGLYGSFSFTKTAHHDNEGKVVFGFVKAGDITKTLQNVAKFTLYKGTTKYKTESTTNNNVVFSNIPKGEYTLKETEAPNGYDSNQDVYTVTVAAGQTTVKDKDNRVVYNSENSSNNMKIANTLNCQNRTLTIVKNWLPVTVGTAVTFNVYQNESATAYTTMTLTSENATATAGTWSKTITVPTVDVETGKTITYTVSEVKTDGYKLLSGNVRGGASDDGNYLFTATNVRSGERTISVSKEWIAPTSMQQPVTVQLMNGSEVKDTVLLKAENQWTASFKTVDTYDGEGQPINYTVVESVNGNAVTDNNTLTIDGNDFYVSGVGAVTSDSVVITNTIAQSTTSVTGTKTWNTVAETGEIVAEFTLYADGIAVDSMDVSNAQNSIEFDNLPKYALSGIGTEKFAGITLDGHEIVYTIAETSTGTSNLGSIVETHKGNSFTNTLTNLTSVTVNKVWNDNDDAFGTRPDSIQVQLLANGEVANTITMSASAVSNDENEDSNVTEYVWTRENLTYTFDRLQMYDSNGALITYTVAEILGDNGKVAGKNGSYYTATVDGTTITNTLNGTETSIQVSKNWVDAETSRNAAANISLYYNGALLYDVNGNACTWTTSNDGDHTFNIFLFDGYNADLLTASEEVVNGYNDGVAAVGVWNDSHNVVTFKNVINQDNSVSVSGTKTWVSGTAATRPNVTISLYADGVLVDSITTLAATEDENVYSYSFTNLPMYAIDVANGTCSVISYTVSETMSGTNKDRYVSTPSGYDFTNTFDAGSRTVSGTKIWRAGEYSQEVTVGLFDEEGMVSKTTTSGLEFSFANLPMYNLDGSVKQYYVRELDENDNAIASGEKLGEYTVTYGDNFSIINTLASEQNVTVTVNKTWVGPKADSASFTVTRTSNGIADSTFSQTVVLNDENNWTASIANLDSRDSFGYSFAYDVNENGAENGVFTANNHTYDVVKTASGTTFAFTNTVQQENNVSVSGTKTWQNVPTGVTVPSTIEVALVADGVVLDNTTQRVNTIEGTYSWDNLPRFNMSTGNEVVYSVVEKGAVNSGADDNGNSTYMTKIHNDYYVVEYDGMNIINHYAKTDIYSYRVDRVYNYYVDGNLNTDNSAFVTGKTVVLDYNEMVVISDEDIEGFKTTDGKSSYTFVDGTPKLTNAVQENVLLAVADDSDEETPVATVIGVILEEANNQYVITLYYELRTSSPIPFGPIVTPADVPEEEIPEEDVPQTDLPADEDPTTSAGEENIPDEDAPLADAPSAVTGDTTIIWIVLMLSSCVSLVVIISDKKRRNN